MPDSEDGDSMIPYAGGYAKEHGVIDAYSRVRNASNDIVGNLSRVYCMHKKSNEQPSEEFPTGLRQIVASQSSSSMSIDRLEASGVEHGTDRTAHNNGGPSTESPSQKTANIRLLRKSLLGMQSSHCIPETPLQKFTAGPSRRKPPSEASTQHSPPETSVTELNVVAPVSQLSEASVVKTEYGKKSKSSVEASPACGNTSCSGRFNACASMEMLMKAKAGDIAPAMAHHIVASLYNSTNTSREGTPARQ